MPASLPLRAALLVVVAALLWPAAAAAAVQQRGDRMAVSPVVVRAQPALEARAAPRAAGSAALSFGGPGLQDAASTLADPQADVGPSQVVAVAGDRVRSYDKATGAPDGALDLTTEALFAPVLGAGAFTTSPRLRYDRLSQRWYLLVVEQATAPATRLLLAVSSTATLGPATSWGLRAIATPAGELAGDPSLGIDAHALHIGTMQFSNAGAVVGTDAYVVQKAPLVAGTAPAVTRFDLLTSSSGEADLFAPQGVDDPQGTQAAGWFIGVDNASFSRLDLRKVTDPGGPAPTLGPVQAVDVPATTFPVPVPHLGNTGGANGRLAAGDDRLLAAQLRDGRIWTAHAIGVNASGFASTPTRTASRWYAVDVRGPAPALSQSGTVFDPSPADPRSFWVPTVAVNGQGTMLLGGSTAGAAAFVDAFHTGRLAGDAPGTTDPPTRYTTAAAAYNPPFDSGGPRGRAWGPGSLTRVDPDDDQTLWTIQQHVSAINAWGTRIARVRGPGPATPTSAPGLVAIGEGARTLTLTGAAAGDSAFFDPGPGFPRRFAVTIGCGLTVTGARVISATTAEVTLTSAGATKGSCPVTAINPDGQAATSPVGLVETDTRPVAGDAARTTPVGTALTGRVPASDADGDPTTATLVDGPAHGTLELAPSGSYT